MRRLLFLAALALADCTRGNLGENCNADGTCNTPSLACRPDSNGHGCYPKPEAKTCNGDADCFCEACLKRCGAAGVKRCEFTDVTVWGSRPTVCECRS